MRKIFLFMMLTIDGYFEGPNHEINWHNVDKEFGVFAKEQLDTTDLLIFGHKTYDMMAAFWPTEQAKKSDPGTAEKMNSKEKIVFSPTLEKAEWEHTTIKKSVSAEEINALKALPGKDIAIFGSSNLCVSFLKERLLDEIRIMVNPIVLGNGNTLFDGLDQKIHLKRLSSRSFTNGNILITYEVLK